jgi:hypothetical protein
MENTVAAPRVLGSFLQPGFPFAKVFTVYFLADRLVFAKTGTGPTNAGGTMQAALGGFTAAALAAKAVGTLVDASSEASRDANTAMLGGLSPDAIVAAHKLNFQLPFDAVRGVTIKGPNFAGEVKVVVTADREHKFRIDKQSKASAQVIIDAFRDTLGSKVTVD